MTSSKTYSDDEIIKLIFEKAENPLPAEKALTVISEKYMRYLKQISYSILENKEDSEECASDALFRIWQSIPPMRPSNLKAFLVKITRNLALDRVSASNAAKRGGGQYNVVLDEIAESIPSGETISEKEENEKLKKCINDFVKALKPRSQGIFIRRYWYFQSIEDIATSFNVSEDSVRNILYRERIKLKKLLEKEGLSL